MPRPPLKRLVQRYRSGVTVLAGRSRRKLFSRGKHRAAPVAASLKSGSLLRRQTLGARPHRDAGLNSRVPAAAGGQLPKLSPARDARVIGVIDALGRTHRFVEKVPVVTTDDLDELSTYPRPAAIDCEVISRGFNDAGEWLITVDTSRPSSIGSTTGESIFVVRPDQLDDVALPSGRNENLVVFVDVDDTLVRSAGTKRIPIPHVVQHVRDLAQAGAAMYLWSRAGADYARATAAELGIAACFRAFLPKPNILLDDEGFASWRSVAEIHPSSCHGLGVDDYRRRVTGA